MVCVNLQSAPGADQLFCFFLRFFQVEFKGEGILFLVSVTTLQCPGRYRHMCASVLPPYFQDVGLTDSHPGLILDVCRLFPALGVSPSQSAAW